MAWFGGAGLGREHEMDGWQALGFEPSASTQGPAGSGTAWLGAARRGRGNG